MLKQLKEIQIAVVKTKTYEFNFGEFITNTLDIASIDFYGPSIGENKKTFLKIISLSSTPLKFQWIKEEDADIIFEKLQKMIYKK